MVVIEVLPFLELVVEHLGVVDHDPIDDPRKLLGIERFTKTYWTNGPTPGCTTPTPNAAVPSPAGCASMITADHTPHSTA